MHPPWFYDISSRKYVARLNPDEYLEPEKLWGPLGRRERMFPQSAISQAQSCQLNMA